MHYERLSKKKKKFKKNSNHITYNIAYRCSLFFLFYKTLSYFLYSHGPLTCAVIALVATEAFTGTRVCVADTTSTARLEVSVSTVSVMGSRVELVCKGSVFVVTMGEGEASVEVVVQDDLLARDVLLGLRHVGRVGVELLLGPDLGDAVHVQVAGVVGVRVRRQGGNDRVFSPFTIQGNVGVIDTEEHRPVTLVEAVSGAVLSNRSSLAGHIAPVGVVLGDGIDVQHIGVEVVYLAVTGVVRAVVEDDGVTTDTVQVATGGVYIELSGGGVVVAHLVQDTELRIDRLEVHHRIETRRRLVGAAVGTEEVRIDIRLSADVGDRHVAQGVVPVAVAIGIIAKRRIELSSFL